MQHSQAVELGMFLVSCAVFFSYHTWLFFIRARVQRHSANRFNIWSINRQARGAWAIEVSSASSDALQTYAVQALRNSITAASFLATACSLIAVTGIGNTILDIDRVERLEQIAASDPALNGGPGIFSATTKLAITEATVLFSFLCFTQSIRLQTHMAFYAKNIASVRNTGIYRQEELVAMSSRASLCFTLGLRAFYAFIPLLMWAAGPSWLLVITVLEVISLIFTDSIPLPKTMPYAAVEQQAKPDIERGEPLLDNKRRNDAKTEGTDQETDLTNGASSHEPPLAHGGD